MCIDFFTFTQICPKNIRSILILCFNHFYHNHYNATHSNIFYILGIHILFNCIGLFILVMLNILAGDLGLRLIFQNTRVPHRMYHLCQSIYVTLCHASQHAPTRRLSPRIYPNWSHELTYVLIYYTPNGPL